MAWNVDAFSRSLGGLVARNRACIHRRRPGLRRVGRSGRSHRTGRRRPSAAASVPGVSLATRRHARTTMARKAAALRCYFSWSARRGDVTVDPARRLTAPSGGARLPRVLDRGEIAALIESPQSVTTEEPMTATPLRGPSPAGVGAAATRARDDAVLELLYGCGLRVAELCGLDDGDIDVAGRMVTVWGKGGRQRRVPMHDLCAAGGHPVDGDGPSPLRRSGVSRRGDLPEPGRPAPRSTGRQEAPGPSLARAHAPPCATAQLRHPPARWWRRPACRPGTPGSRQPPDHPGLHSCQQGAAALGLRSDASPCVGRVGDRRRRLDGSIVGRVQAEW